MKYSRNFYQIRSNEEIFAKILKERESIGYYRMPYVATTQVKEFAKTVSQTDIVVLGIGGSSLGTYAIYKFLEHKTNGKKLHFLESTDPLDVAYKLKGIDLNDALFIIISKSGTTIETVSIFKYLHTLTQIDSQNCIVVTEYDSKLKTYADSCHIKSFDLPKDVGGRFSVFSNVGLLPLAIVGIDIDALLEGAKEVSDSYFGQNGYYDEIMQKARFMIENKNRFNINVLFSYSSLLEGFNKWYVQLWGESLGKANVNATKQGLTPVGLLGPIDQHSFLQLIMEGKRDKTVTFVKIDDFQSDLVIPDISLMGLEELDMVNNLAFNELINMQADATIEAINNLRNIPCDVITIDRVDEKNIGKLMQSFMVLTSVIGKFMQINTYDQPGVEAGKIILKQKLSQKGE